MGGPNGGCAQAHPPFAVPGPPYAGGIRIAPSSRIVSPFM
jgi:hypothetical protein